MFKKVTTPIIVILLVAITASSAFAAPAAQADKTIVDIAVEDGRFTTLVTALQAAELVDTLQGEGPFTVFAPTDDAFAALPEGTLDSLLADIPALTNVLLYHVVSGKVMAADVVSLSSADTVLGKPVNISVADGNVKINDASVIITDIEASNGVIHVIDSVILPPGDDKAMMEDNMMADEAASCSMDYVVQADDWLSKLADKFYGDPLAYHMIFDATNAAAAAGGAYDPIANADLIEIGQTLCIPGDVMTNTIVDIAVADGRFTTLVTALQAAELVDTLQGEGPFTVFAPTDDAFAALPEGTLDSLLADIPALTNVLLYHVVAGSVPAADVVTLNSADTVLGQPVSIMVSNGTVKVNDSQVVITDIEASNGIIHVIDAVLIP
jgi:transforming growth factor-beta-induced protein